MSVPLTYPELQTIVGNVITAAKLSNATFSVTRDNTAGLVDKIGKIVTLDTVYAIDKLSMFDGEYLSYGKTIEEWSEDLILPDDYDSTGASALSPHDPSYRPAFYSYTVGRKTIATTIRYNDLERAVHFDGQLAELISMKVKRLSDSMAVYRYGLKREMLAKYIGLAVGAMSASNATFATATAYSVGTFLKDANTPTAFGVVFKAIPASPAIADWATAVAGGYIIVLDLVQEIAVPVDDATGEAFIEQVKADVEIASDLNAGHSLNGNALGATEGLVLVIKQGVMPNIEVQTLAGAFHDNRLAIPAEIVVVKDFGSDSNDAYAVLMDRRGMRLHNTYNATFSQENGEGAFQNLFRHTEDTAFASRNTFFKVYVEPGA